MARIVIVGGSYGGINTAHTLAHRLGRRHRIVLIAAVDEFVYRPALVYVAVDLREAGQIRRPLAPGLRRRGIEFVQDTVEQVDPHGRRVVGRNGEHEYDFLVLAPGAEADWSGIEGGAEHAHTLLWMDDAVKLREALAAFRGGAVVMGIQRSSENYCPAYELPFLLDAQLQRRGLRQRTTITVFSGEEAPCAVGGPRASRLAERAFHRRRIGFVAGTQATSVDPVRVCLDNGTELASDLTVIIPPYRARAPFKQLAPPTGDGRLPVDRHMRSVGHENVFGAGDAVESDGPRNGRMAQQQGRVAGSNIASLLQGKAPDARYDSDYPCQLDLGLGGGLTWMRQPAPGRGRPVTYFTLSGPPVKWAKLALERSQLAKIR